ncbi:MAG: DUF4129 domain-containing protein [Dehalococcoidia bacterium]
MNARSAGASLAFLAAAALCAYGGVAFAVAIVADGESVSFAAPAAVVALSYTVGRLLGRTTASDDATRPWAIVGSLVLLALILQIEIAGVAHFWGLPPLLDLLLDPTEALGGHAGDLTEVALLGAVWAWGFRRGLRESTPDELMAEAGIGLGVVVVVAALAGSTSAPDGLRWLPAPYMFAVFLALALANLRSTGTGASEPFLPFYAMWTAGALAAIAGLSLLASLVEPPTLDGAGRALEFVAGAVAAAVALVFAPFILAIAWTVQHLVGWLPSRNELPEPPVTGPFDRVEPDESNPPAWAQVLGYVVRSGLVALLIAFALALFWSAMRRRRRHGVDEPDVRESVEPVPNQPLSNLRALLAGALGRLPGRSGQGPRDAIGRLYVSVLRQSAVQGLARPQSATALEFAAELRAHWGSPVVEAISHAYSEARYGRLQRPREEVENLRSGWEELLRRTPRMT